MSDGGNTTVIDTFLTCQKWLSCVVFIAVYCVLVRSQSWQTTVDSYYLTTIAVILALPLQGACSRLPLCHSELLLLKSSYINQLH
jgi:hypothetical protein